MGKIRTQNITWLAFSDIYPVPLLQKGGTGDENLYG